MRYETLVARFWLRLRRVPQSPCRRQSRDKRQELWGRECHQSRPQSPRYPCPAERENEDLWEDAFELGISLAEKRTCVMVPEVRKTIILLPDFQI